LRDLLPAEQKATIQLAAILRLANALDATHDGRIRRIQIEDCQGKNARIKSQVNHLKQADGFRRKVVGLAPNEALVIAAEGYSTLGASAQTIAAERHLLETVLRRPVILKPMKLRPR
jgi:hypothetical protein